MNIGVENLQKALQDAEGWLSSVAMRLGLKSRNTGWAALRATLHALRDQLDRSAVVAFGNDLPDAIRGLWYDGWRPERAPTPATRHEHFMGRIENHLGRAPRLKAERAAKAAFGAICARMPAAAMARVIARLPEDLVELWPDEPRPYTDVRSVLPVPAPLDEARRSRTSPRRLRHATRRAPGEQLANALPERRAGGRTPRQRAGAETRQSRSFRQ